ncbi:hypothetical protein ACFYYB_26260 [Streptomyces sp. NPDC002886]|uniref:hypothetical protein n=1 Tax=Streptomyces sp. NPDC002886 TaxID=3364667 RepID=UPI0036C76BC7
MAFIDAMGHGLNAAAMAIGAYRPARRVFVSPAEKYTHMGDSISRQFGPDQDGREGLDNLLQKLELLVVLTNRGLLEVEYVAALFPWIPTTFTLVRPYVGLHRSERPGYATQTEKLVGRYCH